MSVVQTVTGPVASEDLGFTLTHEHLSLAMWQNNGHGSLLLLEDEDLLAAELQAFKALGGGCIVDQTPRGCGRSPERARRLAERTGLSVVMGCGWYTEPFYPPEDALARRSVGSIADQLVQEIETGIDGTGVKPGLIGEIGVAQGWLSPLEERVHRAVARAHVRTGLPIGTHTTFAAVGPAQLDIFEEEGVDLRRVCIGHCDSQPYLDYCLALLRRGVYIAFDNIGLQMGRMEERVAGLITQLIEQGFAERILLSHDVGQTSELRYFGGRGFTYVSETFLPRLRDAGLSAQLIELLTVENPQRFLAAR
jgi:predicted metal-dependent phosphotriesterase family hydrolase